MNKSSNLKVLAFGIFLFLTIFQAIFQVTSHEGISEKVSLLTYSVLICVLILRYVKV